MGRWRGEGGVGGAGGWGDAAQPLSSVPLVSHFMAFSGGAGGGTPLSALADMSSHHSYFTVISIVSPFISFHFSGFVSLARVVFSPSLSKESSLFHLFLLLTLGEQGLGTHALETG